MFIVDLIKQLIDLIVKNPKAVFMGMFLTLTILWLIGKGFGVTPNQLVDFVLSHEDEVKTLGEELKALNEKVDDAEQMSKENQQWMVEIIQKQFKNKEESQDFKKFLNMSNENQDIIRALLEFGRFYAILVETNDHNEKTLKHLKNMYQAFVYVIADNPEDKNREINSKEIRETAINSRKKLCKIIPDAKICLAKKLLQNVYRNISDFPASVRDDVKIELLRYLSYCAARAQEPSTQKIYTKHAKDTYDRISEKRKSKDDIIDPETYRRLYFWIDYSQLVSIVKNNNIKVFKKEAKKIFIKMQENLVSDDDFLTLKLLQHENLFNDKPDRQDYWRELIMDSMSGH